MIRFECDSCHQLKGPDEAWILGFAAENIGFMVARREVTIASQWDDARAVEPLAVHFCSDACQESYTARLFREEPHLIDVAAEVAVKPLKRVVRVFPGRKVETRALRRKSKSSERKTRRNAD